VCFLAVGGRFDHAAAVVSTLYEFSDMPIVLVTPYNLIWLLRAGKHTIVHDSTAQGTTCGLLPMGQPVRQITSRGLKWDLGGEWGSLAMGVLCSSSNEVEGIGVGLPTDLQKSGLGVVTVVTSEPVVWTTTLGPSK
jgi:thiamine pyrophosphokinase